jgi:hypothetical protein
MLLLVTILRLNLQIGITWSNIKVEKAKRVTFDSLGLS